MQSSSITRTHILKCDWCGKGETKQDHQAVGDAPTYDGWINVRSFTNRGKVRENGGDLCPDCTTDFDLKFSSQL